MVALACAADPRFAVSRLDAPHPDGTPNYTIHALQALREEWPDARLFNIVGADSFATLAQWHDPIRLLSLAEWIVVSRPGIGLAPPPGLSLTAQQLARIHPLDTLHEDVSATELRHRLHAGDACTDLLPPEVDRYIQQQELYR
jgi:nicotinate-nucleotide adenylyltransferase